MNTKEITKKLFSFYIEPGLLDKIRKLSAYASTKGKNITVAKLINFAVQKFVVSEMETVEQMDHLVNEIKTMNITEEEHNS